MYKDNVSQIIVPYQIGDRIGNRYEVVKILWGGMGYVLVCKDLKTKILVALKTFNPQTFNVNGFLSEARNWISLGDHLNIVAAFDVLKDRLATFVIMEYIGGSKAGVSLREWLDTSQQLDLKRILQFAFQICNGLEYAYSKINLVHQDIKPGNLLITYDEILKVADFGLSNSIFGKTVSGGTLPYMSPEHFYGDTDMRSDIYSVGITIYEMIEGHPPFLGRTREEFKRQHEDAKVVFSKRAHSTTIQKLQNIVLKAIEKSLNKRYQSYSEIKNDIDYIYNQQYGISLKKQFANHKRSTSLRLSDRGFALCALGFEEEGMDFLQDAVAKDPTDLVALDAISDYMDFKKRTTPIIFRKRLWQQLVKDFKVVWKDIMFILLSAGIIWVSMTGFEFPVAGVLYCCFALFLLVEAYINFYTRLSLHFFTLSGIVLGIAINLILSFIYSGHAAFDGQLFTLGKSIFGIALGFFLGLSSRKIGGLLLHKEHNEELGGGTVRLMAAIGALVGGRFLYIYVLWSWCSLIWFYAFYSINKFRRIILRKKKIFVGDYGERSKLVDVPSSLGFLGAFLLYIFFREWIDNFIVSNLLDGQNPVEIIIGKIWKLFVKYTFYRY